MARSVNFVVLGDHSISADLGKKGTVTDIAIYDKKTSEAIITFTAPVTFPDKIQALMQAISLAEYAILNVTKLDRFLGEQVIAADYADLAGGFILHSYEIDEEKLKGLVKNTTLSRFKFVDTIDRLKQEITGLEPKGKEGQLVIPIDHAFDVKGVGTVVLGVVKQGSVHVYDEAKIMPSGKRILVKSIQMHDDPVDSASSPARVGLAIKGATAEEISRGDVVCSFDSSLVATSEPIPMVFEKCSFFKGDLAENQTYLISVGLQVKPVKVRAVAGTSKQGTGTGQSFEILPEKPIVYSTGQVCVLLKPDSQGVRIVGKGLLG
jgi:selenocysteine-specific translation elongation factor